jgi:hypothetical protein
LNIYVTKMYGTMNIKLIVCSGFILKLLSAYLPLYDTEIENNTTVDLLLSYDIELDRNSYMCLHVYIYWLILHDDKNLYLTKY